MLALNCDLQFFNKISAITAVRCMSRCKKPVPEIGKTTYVYKNVPEYPHPEEFEKDEFLPRRLSYWPEGIGQLRPKQKIKPWARVKEHITIYPPEEKILPEFTEEPIYPEIDDFRVSSYSADDERRNRRKWYNEIKELPTFEQKMFEIVDIKSHSSVMLKAWSHTYDNLPLFKRLTNTRVIDNLPEGYHSEVIDDSKLKESIMDSLSLHLTEAKEKQYGYEIRGKMSSQSSNPRSIQVENLIEDIVSMCMKRLSGPGSHLLNAQIDYQPDIRSFWFVSGLPTPSKHIRYRRLEIVDQAVQYNDSAVLNIRSREPLPSIDHPESIDYSTTSANYNYHPRFLGYKLKWNYPQCLPGYWPSSDQNSFPFLSVYSRQNLNARKSLINPEFCDEDDATVGIGLMSSFAWLNAIAGAHGFTPYHELTYPFTTQTVVTDGQYWSFFVYQLNKHTFHSDLEAPNVENMCWTSGTMKLFDKFEDGVFHGVRGEVLDNLIMFFNKKPVASLETQLAPYLGIDSRSEQEIASMFERLKRRYGQLRSYEENLILARSRVPTYEHIFERPSYAPSTQNWRKPWRYYNKIRNNRNRFTV